MRPHIPAYHFYCVLCGTAQPWKKGADDVIDRLLGGNGDGVCDVCWVNLPDHVHVWAEAYEARLR